MTQTTTVGDEFALDTITVLASEGYTLLGSTVRVLLFVGRFTEPTFLVTYEPDAEQVTWTPAGDGASAELDVTVAPDDWTGFAPATVVEMRVRVEVTGAGLDASSTFGPVTLRPESIEVEPDVA